MNHSMKTIFSLPKTETRMVIVSLACLALFAGCSFAPKYAEPSVQTPAAFKEMTPSQASAKLTAGKPPSQWTMSFAANGGKCFTSRS